MTPRRCAPGRVALVTGAAQGLGRAIAQRLHEDGFRLALADIDEARLAATQREFIGAGADALAITMDVADEAAVAAGFARLASATGRLDVLVNNAGIIGLDDGHRPRVETMSLALWQRTLDVNLTGVFLACRAAIPLMKAGGWGRIVNMSSRAGRTRTGTGHSNYAATKAGLIGFSRVLAGEVGRDGITVNCVAPSRVPTAMTAALADSAAAFERNVAETAVGRLATAGDVAEAVAFLASDAASFLTGIVVDVNGGSYMP
jgi:3-oxoacyl-[acyl-carrier protein] reductase